MTCRDAAERTSRASDTDTPGGVGLAVHLALCRNCRRFRRLVGALSAEDPLVAAADSDAAGLPEDAKARLQDALRAAADQTPE